jgi:hypothetical protein
MRAVDEATPPDESWVQEHGLLRLNMRIKPFFQDCIVVDRGLVFRVRNSGEHFGKAK